MILSVILSCMIKIWGQPVTFTVTIRNKLSHHCLVWPCFDSQICVINCKLIYQVLQGILCERIHDVLRSDVTISYPEWLFKCNVGVLVLRNWLFWLWLFYTSFVNSALGQHLLCMTYWCWNTAWIELCLNYKQSGPWL